jgi:hypothetical protein
MLFEEVPDRLAHVDEVAGPVMTEILDRIENHIGSRLAIAPLLFADQNIVRDIHRFGVTPVSPRPGCQEDGDRYDHEPAHSGASGKTHQGNSACQTFFYQLN